MKNLSTTTSYAGHGCGALAGVLIGIFILKNRKVDDWVKKSLNFIKYTTIKMYYHRVILNEFKMMNIDIMKIMY